MKENIIFNFYIYILIYRLIYNILVVRYAEFQPQVQISANPISKRLKC